MYGHAIHASIGSTLVNKFKSKIKEDSIYIIKTFKVLEYEKYRPLKNNLKINFVYDTTVKEVDEGKSKFLDYHFEFADGDTLESRVNIDKQFLGLIKIHFEEQASVN